MDDGPSSKWTVAQLKEFLKAHGGKISGRKGDLLERSLFYRDNPDAAKTKAAVKRLSKEDNGNAKCVEPGPIFPESGWTSDSACIPLVTAATVLGHLSKTGKVFSSDGSADKDSILVCQKPLRRGNDFFFGGYIHDVSVSRSESSVFVKSKCWASQKKYTKYNQRLLLSEQSASAENSGCLGERGLSVSCAVEFAACEGCPAGANGGFCQHIFALLLTLEHNGPRAASTCLPGPQSVTSQPRQWGIRKRNVDPQPIMSLMIERPTMKPHENRRAIDCTLREALCESLPDLMQEHIVVLKEALQDGCRMKKLLPSHSELVKLDFGELAVPEGCLLHQQLTGGFMKKPSKSDDKGQASHGKQVNKKERVFPPLPLKEATCENISPEWRISLVDAQNLESQTVLQRASTQWCELHQYTITSSNFKGVLKCKTGAQGLLQRIFDGPPLDLVNAVAHGQRNEEKAVAKYKDVKRENNQPVEVRPCGLVLHTNHRFLGASPDGLVFDEKSQPSFGLLEVKCPFKAFSASLSIEEACADPTFCCHLLDGKPVLRRNHAFYYQVQGQLAITGAKWCDFFVWLDSSWCLERIAVDEHLWTYTLLPTLASFYDLHARPYLSSKGRPVPPKRVKQKGVASQQLSNFSQCELLLPSNQAQSTIGGRNGSSACSLISGLFLHHFLASDGQPDVSPTVLCKVMSDGNAVYDHHKFSGLLSSDDVLNLRPSLGLKMLHEKFLNPGQLSTLVLLLEEECLQSVCRRSAAMFVRTPYTFSMCCSGTEVILFDSHIHHECDSGALIAQVPVSHAEQYLRHFFDTYYPQLFVVGHNTVAHVTFVHLS